MDNVNNCDEFFELFLFSDTLTSNVIQTRALNPLHLQKSMEFVRKSKITVDIPTTTLGSFNNCEFMFQSRFTKQIFN